MCKSEGVWESTDCLGGFGLVKSRKIRETQVGMGIVTGRLSLITDRISFTELICFLPPVF